jgi:hypothetical protein
VISSDQKPQAQAPKASRRSKSLSSASSSSLDVTCNGQWDDENAVQRRPQTLQQLEKQLGYEHHTISYCKTKICWMNKNTKEKSEMGWWLYISDYSIFQRTPCVYRLHLGPSVRSANFSISSKSKKSFPARVQGKPRHGWPSQWMAKMGLHLCVSIFFFLDATLCNMNITLWTLHALGISNQGGHVFGITNRLSGSGLAHGVGQVVKKGDQSIDERDTMLHKYKTISTE